MVFYAVVKGNTTGVFNTWAECEAPLNGFAGGLCKKFETREEAKRFLANGGKEMPYFLGIVEEEEEEPAKEESPDYYVYTDGSCSNNGQAGAQAGIGVYFGEGDIRNVSRRVEGKQTNNTAEVGAIIAAYKIIEKDIAAGKRIAIVSDSIYAIRCATTYGKTNAKSGWLKDIPNKDLVKQVYEQYKDKKNVSFIHIAAHTGGTDPHFVGNDGADRLANNAIGLESCPYATSASVFGFEALLPASLKIYLNVPFAQKDAAKKMGASWDKDNKKWYILETNPHKAELLAKYN